MTVPTICLLKDCSSGNSVLKRGAFDLPFKAVNQTMEKEPACEAFAGSVVLTEITDADDEDLKDQIDSLPPGCLPNGDEKLIDLSRRQLERFPVKVFSQCKGLEFLYLHENCLESLPEELFTAFPLLRRLDVRKNKLSSIPAIIGDHPSLEVLLLQGNKITTLPAHLGYCRKLRNLQLQGNPLEWPDKKTVQLGTGGLLAYLRKHDKPDAECEDSSEDDGERSGVCDFTTRNNCGDFGEGSLTMASTNESQAAKNATQIDRQGGGESCRTTSSKGQIARSLPKFTSKSSLPRQKSSHRSTSAHEQATLACRKGKFPLGYKKRSSQVQTQHVYRSLLERLWNDLLQEEMFSQNSSLQRFRNREALADWRKETRLLQITSTGRKKPIAAIPFDHEEGLRMMTWRDLIHARNHSLEKKGNSKAPPSVRKAPGARERVLKLFEELDKLTEDNTRMKAQNNFLERPEYQFNLERQIRKMQELQKSLLPLRIL